jgi:hypothetical protein
LTVMPSKADQVYYYEGLDPSKIQASTFKAIRDVILDKKRRTDPKDFMVIIKPSKDATYKNTVDMLDEMKIDDVKRYALVDLTPDEYKYVAATETANGVK